jgi:Protein of unknown function (DUF2806)
VSFVFPPESRATERAEPQNPWGGRVASILGEALNVAPDQIGMVLGTNKFEASSELGEGAKRRRADSLSAVLELAALEEIPLNLPANKPDVPDRGWLELFLHLSGFAGSALEREIWARILVLELAEPRTISRRALQFVHLMDHWELEAFVEYCAFAFSFESGWRFMFEGDLVRREIWSYGREADLSHHWIDVGLLSHETASLAPHRIAGLPLLYRSKCWEVKLLDDAELGAVDPIRYRKFTALGQQIASAVAAKTFNGYARNVIKVLQGQHDHVLFSSLEDKGA